MIELIPCGTLVKLKIGEIDGMITGINIRWDNIQYEVTYYLNGEIKETWFNEFEFTTENNIKKIGYK